MHKRHAYQNARHHGVCHKFCAGLGNTFPRLSVGEPGCFVVRLMDRASCMHQLHKTTPQNRHVPPLLAPYTAHQRPSSAQRQMDHHTSLPPMYLLLCPGWPQNWLNIQRQRSCEVMAQQRRYELRNRTEEPDSIHEQPNPPVLCTPSHLECDTRGPVKGNQHRKPRCRSTLEEQGKDAAAQSLKILPRTVQTSPPYHPSCALRTAS